MEVRLNAMNRKRIDAMDGKKKGYSALMGELMQWIERKRDTVH